MYVHGQTPAIYDVRKDERKASVRNQLSFWSFEWIECLVITVFYTNLFQFDVNLLN